MSWTMDIDAALSGRSRKATITVRDDAGKIVGTYHNDLRSQEGRRRVARQMAQKLAGDAAMIERRLEDAWTEALNRLEQEPPPPEPSADATVHYDDSSGYLCWLKPTPQGEVPVALANFTARITKEMVRDDGVEQSTIFVVEGKLATGEPLPRVEVPSQEYHGMRWTTKNWGNRAVVYAGAGTADHLRVAIQLLSGVVPRRTVYTHTGWRWVRDRNVYLHGGGAIGPDGLDGDIAVSLPDALANYILPEPTTGQELIGAIRASLRLLELGAACILFALLAAVYRTVLGGTDFSLHLSGPTGCYKTEVAALAQQHFGAGLDARHLPASWLSTGNALEGIAFAAKDALLVVDDFAPTGSVADVQRYHREADRLLRAQGNRAGRQRMRADASLKPAKPPRGMTLGTGEDTPRGQSLRARNLIIEVSPADLGPQPPTPNLKLTACQKDASTGLYAQTLAGFLRWLAPQYDAVRARLKQEHAELRDKALTTGQHARTPGIVADLALGLRYFLDFALWAGAVTADERAELARRAWKALGEAAAAQAKHQRDAEPCGHFLRLLAGAISSGRAHVAARDGGAPADAPEAWGWQRIEFMTRDGPDYRWDPRGHCIGWLDNQDLYLEPEAAFAEAQDLARHQGESLTVSCQTLARRLKERRLLVSWDQARLRNTVRRALEGVKDREVLHVHSGVLSLQEPSKPSAGHTGGPKSPEKADGSADGSAVPAKNRTLEPSAKPEENPVGGRFGRSDTGGESPTGANNPPEQDDWGEV
jgi:hypothetical protein